MYATRTTLLWIAIGLGVFSGWKHLSRAAQEVVVLRASGVGHDDHFASLWVIDDGDFTWIRAENPRRLWLRNVRDNPEVELRRGGRSFQYRATVFDTPSARAYVDARFRAKYGLADRVRELLGERDTLPIRLEAR